MRLSYHEQKQPTSRIQGYYTTTGRHRPTPEYNSWIGIKSRCYNPTATGYAEYGGRGIKVCERWLLSFENFLADVGAKPSSRHTLDRIDVNGDYEPGNCRWSTPKEQGRNRRTNRLITAQGRTLPICVWSEIVGVNTRTIIDRLNRGWSDEDSITPAHPRAKPR